jgi:hypothetical protein
VKASVGSVSARLLSNDELQLLLLTAPALQRRSAALSPPGPQASGSWLSLALTLCAQQQQQQQQQQQEEDAVSAEARALCLGSSLMPDITCDLSVGQLSLKVPAELLACLSELAVHAEPLLSALAPAAALQQRPSSVPM